MAQVSIMQEQLSTDRHRPMAQVSIMQEQLSASTSCASSLLHIHVLATYSTSCA
jgi:hypothetical protein